VFEEEEKRGVVNLRGNILRMLLIIFLVVSTMTVVSVSTASPGPAVISVEPPTSTAGVGESFTVDINITDVSNLYSWEFHMSFNDPKTDTWTGDNVTKSFVTTGKPVLYETQEIYVNHALMPEVMEETDTWTGDNVTKTFSTTIKPIVEYSETVIANFTDTWTGNGLTTTFLTTKKPIVKDSEKVYVNQILMTKPADYNVTSYEGGFIVFTTAPGDGAEIKATYRATAKKEEHYKIDYVAGTVMFIETPENGAIIEATYRYAQYTIEYSTGIITFRTAPGLEAEIEAIYLTPPIIEVVDVTEGPFLSDVDSTSWSILPPYIDNTKGIVKASNILYLWPESGGANGTGTLCTITFQAKDVGNTTLHFYFTVLETFDGMDVSPIEHTTEDGYFSNIHDVAITEVTASPNSVAVGESVSINVTVANKGDFPETFDVTTHWNIGALHGVIGTNVTSLDGRNSTLLRLTWPTTGICTGTYTISAEASVVLGENWIEDNALIDGEVTVNATGQPEANLIYSPTEPKVGENITFTSTSTDPDGTIVSWDWAFDDESIGSGEVVTHAYAETGTYKVTLNVTDDDGICNIVWKPVNVLDYPVASFTYSPEEPLRNRTVTFDASGSTPNGGTIDSYAWDFGDGTTDSGMVVDHIFAEVGTYTVTLNVTDSEGLVNSVTHDVTVSMKHDVAVVSVEIPLVQRSVWAGAGVSITIVVRNEGSETETFNVTTYYDDHIIETRLVTNLTPDASQELKITWDTSDVSAGEYNITAEAILVGEPVENLANNKNATQISVDVADIAITNVIASPTTVLAGDLLNITVVVKNEGESNIGSFLIEIFFTNATHSNMSITDFSIGGLTSGTEKPEWGTWNATKAGISPGTYMLSAKVDRIRHGATDAEFDIDDNVFPRGNIPPINVTVGASLISISANPETITVGSSTTINGTITPIRLSVNVTIQYRLSGNETWNTLETVTTNENGTYSYNWKPETAGTYEVKASWEGDDDTLPGESETLTITVNQAQPNVFLYVLAAVAIIAIAATAIYLLKFRKPKLK